MDERISCSKIWEKNGMDESKDGMAIGLLPKFSSRIFQPGKNPIIRIDRLSTARQYTIQFPAHHLQIGGK